MKSKPLDDLEMYELLLLAYPEKFEAIDDEEEAFEFAQELANDLSGWEEIADLLGRIVMLSQPMGGALSGNLQHCLGDVKVKDGQILMLAAVKREVSEQEQAA
ncbi:hypothetical protein [Marinomonas shanghaiensis]|uniref:hypothetical protein n=1 Tax=Marinomonas shanghaiensis TaxID=2202418 RepID=UPI000DBAD1C1|nr:hypothetical protein [Marinomonas shanghaiensis]